MLKVFLHNAAPANLNQFNRLGRLDIGYEKLDAHADYKTVMSQTGLGEFPPATVQDYPRWTASIWDLVMRAICMGLWGEEAMPPIGLARRGAFADHLTAVVEHWPDGFEQGRSTVGMAQVKMQRKRCRYIATFDDDILGEQTSTEFTHTPDGLSPWDLLARAYAWTCHESFRMPPRPTLYTKLTIAEGTESLVPLEMVKEPARTGLQRWMVSTSLGTLTSGTVTGPCIREADYVRFLRSAV